MAIAGVTAAACLLLLDGFTRKSFCAILGCIGGVAAAGIFAALVGVATPLNGFNMSEAENLLLYGGGAKACTSAACWCAGCWWQPWGR